MIARDEIFQVRQQINEHIGSRVRIRAQKGRKRVVIKEGVLENTYPSIFVVKVENQEQQTFRTVSYSYTDLLTHNVELSLCKD